MKYLLIFGTMLFLISCRENTIDSNKVIELGKELMSKNPIDINQVESIGKGLNDELNRLKKNSTDFKFKTEKGDFEAPFGDENADIRLIITSDSKCIGIRLKYDNDKSQFKVLGWRTILNEVTEEYQIKNT